MLSDLLGRKKPCDGLVLFRGTLPPRVEELDFVRHGVSVRPKRAPEGAYWLVELAHREWGTALLGAPRRDLVPPSLIVDCDNRLDEEGKSLALQAGVVLHVICGARKSNLLQDRKCLLRFLSVVLGSDGLLCFDRTSQRFWTRMDLDDELRHDAELDVDALFTVHVVGGGDQVWLHSHGLGEIDAFDFDILDAHESLLTMRGQDLIRAVAFATLEGLAKAGGEFTLVQPKGVVRFVDATRFNQTASKEWALLRQMDDDSHDKRRLVLCESRSGFFGRWSKSVEPSRFLRRGIDDGTLISFSSAATRLMAQRARGTFPLFARIVDELQGLGLPMLAKIGYPTDHATEDGCEHLWFSVHACRDNNIDATLENDPFDISRLRRGARGSHSVDNLTDWLVISPFGPVSPRSVAPLRMIRRHRDELAAAVKGTNQAG